MRYSAILAVCMVAAVLSSAITADLAMAASYIYSVGEGPRSICTADFDGDGEADLATANGTTNDISILIGVGDGTFMEAVSYATGEDPTGICAAYLNDDAIIDLAVSNYLDDNVSVFLGIGNGTFDDAVNYTIGVDGNAPAAIAAADIDGDGFADLVTANYWGDSVAVLINNGDGTFQVPVKYSLGPGSGPNAICCADFDGLDGIDVAVANSLTDNVSVLLNQGGGTLAGPVNYSIDEDARGITTADLDGDGYYDLATANFASHNVSVLINDGDGTFAASAEYPVAGAATRGICAAKLDDGESIDLAVVTNTSDEVAILPNVGGGTFLPAFDYLVGDGPTSVCATDFNGDGENDLAVTNYYDNTVSILLNGTDVLVGVDNNVLASGLPAGVHLRQNYPNPFNPETIIEFSLSERSYVSVSIYNALGQRVRDLVGGVLTAGDHAISWDGCDNAGDRVAGGVYLCRLKADDVVENRKMLLLK